MIKNILKIAVFFGIGVAIASCSSDAPSKTKESVNSESVDNEPFDDDADEIRDMYTVTLSNSALESVLNSIPSPLEFADELKSENIQFKKEMVAESKSSDEFIGLGNKSIVMGIYGTDLSYINIMQQNLMAAQYYGKIVGLAEDLRVDQFFNMKTIAQLKKNEGNKEELLKIIRSNYRDIHKFLEDQDRAYLSLLMLYGSWIESVHITLMSNKEQAIDLAEKLGDQKITINKLLAVISSVKDKDKAAVKALADLKALKRIYDKVDITYTYDESYLESVEEGNEVDMVDDSVKKIDISDETIALIEKTIGGIRLSLIN